MAEYSRPWAGVTIGDAGPYNTENWYDVWASIARAGRDYGRTEDYNLGVFYAIRNHLDGAINGANVDIDTGACLVDGLYHENDATVSVAINPAAANPRIDYIVVRKNYQQAVTYTPAGAGPTVPPRTARITVIRGTEAAVPVPPALTQDTTRITYWDIPLYTVQVDILGNLTNLTDMREYVDAEMKSFFVPLTRGRNVTAGSDLSVQLAFGTIYVMPDAALSVVSGNFRLPDNYISDATATVLIECDPASPTGNVYGRLVHNYANCSEFYGTDTPAYGAEALAGAAADISCLFAEGVTDGYTYYGLAFYRDGTNILDTVNAEIWPFGFDVRYFGWKK